MINKLTTIILLFIFLLTSGFGCSIKSAAVKEAMKPISITYWRAWDDTDAFSEIIKNYNAIHPNIQIQYKKFRYDEYENELLNALSEDRGPDIFSIPSSWIGKYKKKIEPMPDNITIAYQVVTGSIKKEVVAEIRTKPSLSIKDLRNNFVDTVYSDVVWQEFDDKSKAMKDRVYGLPLYVDTLAMYYNKDLMNNAGISEPPAYWNKTFQQYVQKLTKLNAKGDIIQSGVALGGGSNIDRAGDILSLLMMQNGATMISDTGQVSFQLNNSVGGASNYNPGVEATRFYTDFSNQAKEVYSWNDTSDSSFKMFTSNRLAIMFGYSYTLPLIKAAAPKLNFAIAKMPQIENANHSLNYANYWVETVSKKSQYKNEAWDFVQFMTSADQALSYLNKVKRPTALRALVSKQENDIDIGVFVEQVLTAKDWYKGADGAAADKIMNDLIAEAKMSDDKAISDAVNKAATKIQQTIK